MGELNRVLSSTMMVRRLKNEVLDQLPPKRRQHVSCTYTTLHCKSCLPFAHLHLAERHVCFMLVCAGGQFDNSRLLL